MTADPLAPLTALPGVGAALDEARSAVDGLLGHRLLRRRSAELSAEAGLRCARASAALEGVVLPLEEVRVGSDDPTVQGSLRVSTGLGELVHVIDQSPLQALARLHVFAARGLATDAELGRPRSDPRVGARLAALTDLLVGPRPASALVLAAIVHAELLTLGVFEHGNGLVARAAARLVMVARGLDPKAVTCPDVGHLEREDGYRDAAAAYAAGDVRPWLLHCAEAVRLGAVESVAVCEAIVRTAEAQA